MKKLPDRRRYLAAALLTSATLALPLATLAQDTRPGRLQLSISGKIGSVPPGERVMFDRTQLETLPQKTFTTHTPWDDKPTRFSGPLLRDILATVQARGSQIKAIALNDYKVTIPVADSQKYDVVLALRMNGELIPVRTKGPFFIVYPFDNAPELRSTTYYSRSIWQLKALEVE